MRIKAYMASPVENVPKFIDDCKKCQWTMIKDVISSMARRLYQLDWR